MLFLRSVDVFGAIAGEDLVPVAMVAEEANFRAGEILVRQGESGDGLYVIVEGEVDVVVEDVGRELESGSLTPAGRRPVAVRGAGSVIGEMAVLSGGPRLATCVAMSDILTLRLRRDDFLELLAERPALALGVISVLTQRLDEVTRRLAEALPS